MNARRFAMICALLGTTVLGAVFLIRVSAPRAAGSPHAIELTNGTAVTGVLMRLRPESYLLQSDVQCVVLTADEVRKVDGKDPAGPALPAAGTVPRTQETLESILPSGEIELHSTFTRTNEGRDILSRIDWGMAAHEVGDLDRYRVVDAYGNQLDVHSKDDPSIHGKRAWVDLPRPVLPGEEARLTMIIAGWATAARDGAGWIYKMAGDYPDNRLVTRSVLLPAGARIVSVTPAPLHQITSGDRPLIIWRRYFVQGEIVPWEIRYEL